MSTSHRIFLLSPAYAGGKRGQMLLREEASFPLAARLRSREGAPLGDVFAFVSGLYFRGKLAYSRTFAHPPAEMPGALVITPTRGLVPPESHVTGDLLREFAAVDIDAANPAYRGPLETHVRALLEHVGDGCAFVLLGSVATGKYADVLTELLGPRLLFPSDFVGRGDMSRGGLMLRSAAAGTELEYVPVLGSARHGARPARLPKLPRAPKPTEPKPE